jgi:hypothetical protein
MMQLGMGAAASYMILSAIMLLCFYFFLLDITKKKNKKEIGYVATGWTSCSICIGCLIFISAFVKSLLKFSMMACSGTLVISCLACSSACMGASFN